jgi:hypothetical protein
MDAPVPARGWFFRKGRKGTKHLAAVQDNNPQPAEESLPEVVNGQ